MHVFFQLRTEDDCKPCNKTMEQQGEQSWNICFIFSWSAHSPFRTEPQDPPGLHVRDVQMFQQRNS